MDLQRLYIVVNETKSDALAALTRLKLWCQEHRVEAVPIHDAPTETVERAIVLALGGDGTVLRAATLFEGTVVPILGVNVGSLGFLTQASLGGLIEAVEHVVRDEYDVEERMRLAYKAGGIEGSVLNDLVITGVCDSRFCELTLSWGDGPVAAYPGDGIILSTATGSTAYSLSAGGPVIVPPAACILATPHAPHKLGLRPVIFPPDENVTVSPLQEVQLFADGDAVGHVAAGIPIHAWRAEVPTYLIRLADAPAFFRVLDQKLNWADVDDRRCRSASQPEG
jgi:NAD+ kinase